MKRFLIRLALRQYLSLGAFIAKNRALLSESELAALLEEAFFTRAGVRFERQRHMRPGAERQP